MKHRIYFMNLPLIRWVWRLSKWLKSWILKAVTDHSTTLKITTRFAYFNNSVIVKVLETSIPYCSVLVWTLKCESIPASAWECPKWNCWAQTYRELLRGWGVLLTRILQFLDPWTTRKQLLLTCFGKICTNGKHHFYLCGAGKKTVSYLWILK